MAARAWLLGCLAALAACSSDANGPETEDLRERFDLETLGPIPYPPDNAYDPDRVALGRLLFYDPILSGEQDVACGTCHHPDFHFADGRQFGAGVSGVGLGPQRVLSVSAVSGTPIAATLRNTPTVLNTALAADAGGTTTHTAPMFWDGRAVGLEGQALAPLASRIEMRGDAFPGTDEEARDLAVDSILARLRTVPAYVDRFRSAFSTETPVELVNASTLARAIAAYQRELVTRNSAFDRFVNGDDAALTPVQKDGLEIFFERGKCFVCHHGAMFSNFQFMVTGVPAAGRDDTGREMHTGMSTDRFAFRVPSLRNVELTAPYMHDGVFDTLEETVRFYNDGAQPRHADVTNEMVEVIIREPLDLDPNEIDALVEFLKALTDEGSEIDPMLLTVPTTVPSGLSPVFGVRAGASY
jgi:cytochrome c peroxidase